MTIRRLTSEEMFFEAKRALNPAVEEILYPGMEDCQLDIVIGELSAAFSALDRARVDAAAKSNPRVTSHLIAGAGHWVHVDAPDALVALLTSAGRSAD